MALPDGVSRDSVRAVYEALASGSGAADDTAYADDTGAGDGSVVALLKGIYVQNAAIIALLTAIETNTGTP